MIQLVGTSYRALEVANTLPPLCRRRESRDGSIGNLERKFWRRKLFGCKTRRRRPTTRSCPIDMCDFENEKNLDYQPQKGMTRQILASMLASLYPVRPASSMKPVPHCLRSQELFAILSQAAKLEDER